MNDWHHTRRGHHDYYRLQVGDVTAAAIIRYELTKVATITVRDRSGETIAEIAGDTLDQNKQTALDMMQSLGYEINGAENAE